MKEFNLSDRLERRPFRGYAPEDVKEFIKRLKELIIKEELANPCPDYQEDCHDCKFWKKFKELAGEKLTEEKSK